MFKVKKIESIGRATNGEEMQSRATPVDCARCDAQPRTRPPSTRTDPAKNRQLTTDLIQQHHQYHVDDSGI